MTMQKPTMFAEEHHTRPLGPGSVPTNIQGTLTNPNNRAVRPKPSSSVSYANQLPVETQTHVEIIEHRQRKERLPLKDIDDLIHLSGPLTEDAVMRTLHTRFENDSFYVSVLWFCWVLVA